MAKKIKKRPAKRIGIKVPRRHELAAPPGTVAPPLGARAPKIEVITYSLDGADDRMVESVKEAAALRDESSTMWINVEGVGDAQIFQDLGEVFGLHLLALEDVVSLHQRPKAEDYDDHIYVVLHMPSGEVGLPFEQVSLFIGKGFVVTVQEGRPGDCLGPVRDRIKKGRGRIRHEGADHLAYALIDAVIDNYFPVVERLNGKLEALEERLLQEPDEDAIPEIHAIRSDLHTLRRSLASTREAIFGLARGTTTGPISHATQLFLRDCQDHAAQLLDAVEACRELSASLIDLHQAAVGNRMNEVMRILTVISTIFIPLSFVAGVYGMNFDRAASPWNMPELGWALGYPLALLIMVATGVGFLVFFRRRGWLGRPRR